METTGFFKLNCMTQCVKSALVLVALTTLASMIGCASEKCPVENCTTQSAATTTMCPSEVSEKCASSNGICGENSANAKNNCPNCNMKSCPVAAAAPTDAASASNVFVTGLDRSHWPTITATPADQRTSHNPVYHREYSIQKRYVPLESLSTTNEQLEEVLSDTKPENFGLVNGTNEVIDIAGFGLDTGLLPIRAVLQPPIMNITTP